MKATSAKRLLPLLLLSLTAGLASLFGTQGGEALPNDGTMPLRGYRIYYAGLDNQTAVPDSPAPGTEWDGGAFPPEEIGPDRMVVLETSFRADPELKGAPAGLYLGPTPYPCDIYLNGVQVHKSGQYRRKLIVSAFYSTAVLLPAELIKIGANTLTVRVVPAGYNDPFPAAFVSDFNTASAAAIKRNFFAVHLIRATSFFGVLLALYYLMLFFVGGRKERRYLSFALLSIAFFMAYLEISFAGDALPELALKKASKIGFALMIVFLTQFILEFTNLKRGRRVIQAAALLPAAGFTIFLLKAPVHAGIEQVLTLMLSFYFPLMISIDFVIVTAAFIRRRDRDTLIFLGAFIISIAASLADILVLLFGTIPYTYLTPYGFLAIIIALFLILTLQQISMSKMNREQARNLEKQTGLQQEVLATVTALSGHLKESGEALQRKIGESRRIIGKNAEEGSRMNRDIQQQVAGVETSLPEIKKSLESAAVKITSALENQTAFAEEVQETLSAVMERMTETQASVSDTSRKAETLNGLAENSGRLLRESGKALEEISGYSRIIQKVLDDITDVAEKTDLLAINAAIEAAHAGDAGRGFSVVAGEVRNLSSQSKERASSSQQKIDAMKSAIENNNRLAAEISAGLNRIVSQAVESAELMENTRGSLDFQQTEAREVVESLQSLLQDTGTIREMSEENRRVTLQAQDSLENFRSTLKRVSAMLESQVAETADLESQIAEIEDLFSEVRNKVEKLNGLVS